MKTKRIFGVAAEKVKTSPFATARITAVKTNRCYAKLTELVRSNSVTASKLAQALFATIRI